MSAEGLLRLLRSLKQRGKAWTENRNSKIFIPAEIQGVLECPMCRETLTEPKLLPCGHTFCKVCLQKWANKGRDRAVVRDIISCPLDRKEYVLTARGIGGLPTNRIVVELGALPTQQEGAETERGDEEEGEENEDEDCGGEPSGGRRCDECRRKLDVHHCGHCSLRLCVSCRSLHRDEGRIQLRRCSTRLKHTMPDFDANLLLQSYREVGDNVRGNILAFKEQLLDKVNELVDKKVHCLLDEVSKWQDASTEHIKYQTGLMSRCDEELETLAEDIGIVMSQSDLELIDKQADGIIAGINAESTLRRISFSSPGEDEVDAVLNEMSTLLAGDCLQCTDETLPMTASPLFHSPDGAVSMESLKPHEDHVPRGCLAKKNCSGPNDPSPARLPNGEWNTLGLGTGDREGFFHKPEGFAVSPITGNIYIVDKGNHRIQFFTVDGQYLGAFGRRGSSPGDFCYPESLAFTDEGNLVVIDGGNNRVQMVTAEGRFVQTWGEKGIHPGCFQDPSGVSVNLTTGQILVSDSGNHRVQVFTTSGQFSGLLGSRGGGSEQFRFPWDISVDGDRIAISDLSNHRVQILSTNIHHVLTIQDHVRDPRGVALHQGGQELFVCCNMEILHYALSPQVLLKRTIPSPVGGKKPWRIAVLCPDYILVTLWKENKIYKVAI